MLQILPIDDPRLKEPSVSVDDPTHSDWRALVHSMVSVMRVAGGAGLAAPQVGYNVRLLVMVSDPVETALIGATFASTKHIFNPEIIERSPVSVAKPEGCLSMPGVFFPVPRHDWVTVIYQDLTGAWVQETFKGLAAQVLQHEIDHLDGVRAIDRLTPLRRQRAMNEWAKKKKRGLAA